MSVRPFTYDDIKTYFTTRKRRFVSSFFFLLTFVHYIFLKKKIKTPPIHFLSFPEPRGGGRGGERLVGSHIFMTTRPHRKKKTRTKPFVK